MRNLSRITNYANKIESYKDWERSVDLAITMEQYGILSKYRPNLMEWDWRKIDRCTIGLLEDLSRVVEVDLSDLETLDEKIKLIEWAFTVKQLKSPKSIKENN